MTPVGSSSGAGRASFLVVNEIFGPTVQGEGESLGLPAVFLRVAGCSLSCTWCDTPYSWDWTRHDRGQNATRMSSDEAWDRVIELARGTSTTTLVLTGGEPALQAKGLVPIAWVASRAGWRVEVETAGAVDLGELADAVDLVTVSPKMTSSGMDTETRLNLDVLRSLATRSNVAWKFVIDDARDLDEADDLVTDLGLDEVILMPQATTAEAVLEKLRWLVPQAITRGHRVTPRLHTLVWGDERGR
jgi:7-cyano-7-deazaguanosine (preQ0) biosynthesis protein QueE